jgi:hypothetical protein
MYKFNKVLHICLMLSSKLLTVVFTILSKIKFMKGSIYLSTYTLLLLLSYPVRVEP